MKYEITLTVLFTIFIHIQIGTINIYSLVTSLIVGGASSTLIVGTIRLIGELFYGK